MSDELEMGPVDYIVVEFPDGRRTGDALPRIVDLVDRGLIRILDLVFLRKEADGSVVGVQLADLDGDGELDIRVLEGASSGLVGSEDMDDAASVIVPGSAAAIVLYENLWAIPFATALRRVGAELVAGGRVPVRALIDSLDAADSSTETVDA
jgi:hypothetical protein